MSPFSQTAALRHEWSLREADPRDRSIVSEADLREKAAPIREPPILTQVGEERFALRPNCAQLSAGNYQG
jgi:hypothetical protein